MAEWNILETEVKIGDVYFLIGVDGIRGVKDGNETETRLFVIEAYDIIKETWSKVVEVILETFTSMVAGMAIVTGIVFQGSRTTIYGGYRHINKGMGFIERNGWGWININIIRWRHINIFTYRCTGLIATNRRFGSPVKMFP